MTDVIPSSSFVLDAIDETGNPVTQFNGRLHGRADRIRRGGLAEQGIDEMDQHCLTYDESVQKWLRIATDVDTERKVVTCSADHFTEFAIVGVKVTSGSSMSRRSTCRLSCASTGWRQSCYRLCERHRQPPSPQPWGNARLRPSFAAPPRGSGAGGQKPALRSV